jgi:hypothetical protein
VDQISRIGMDTSKHIFQLHGVNAAEAPVLRKKLRRKEMVAFFEKLAPTVIAIEACGASHHWARLLQSIGHSVKLIPPQLVNPSSRIRGFFGSTPIADQWVGRKGLHYSRWRGTEAVAMRGGGCGGNWSLSCWIRSLSSGSGWV